MRWLKWIVQIILMLLVITVVGVNGWEQITRSDYRHFKGRESQEKQLKREFQVKSKRANNLSAYRKQVSELDKKLAITRETMMRFSTPESIESWCLQLSKISNMKISCEKTKKIDEEFYYEQQVDINLKLKTETLSYFLQTLISDSSLDLDTVFWRNILIKRNQRAEYLDFKATLSFVYWRDDD